MKVSSFFQISVLTILFFYILLVGRDLLIPFFLALIIWYLVNSLAFICQKMTLFHRQLSLPLCKILSALIVAAMLSLLAYLVSKNVTDVVTLAPVYQKKLTALLFRGLALAGLHNQPSLNQVFSIIDIGSLASQLAHVITGFISNTGIILVYLFFLFMEQKSFSVKYLALIDHSRKQQDILKIIDKINHEIRVYIGVKSLISAITAFLCYLVMISQKLDLAEFWAILIFVLNFIPTVGSLVANIMPLMFALIQFDSALPVVIIGVGIFLTDFLIGNFLDPRLMGEKLNLSPLAIILSLALWSEIWGIAGMILCIPLTVIFMIVFSHFPQTRSLAILLSRDGKIVA
ncbi:MAG TPA: AI-2E family transporter [bacterium]|nr:AI-2E family transporter [bacterium]HPN42455.1 AI-2E family transporter [bacterium]